MNHKCYSTARHTVEIRQCCDRRMESKSTLSADSLLYKTSFAVNHQPWLMFLKLIDLSVLCEYT